ncbi:MAG: Hsp33 family molecular chaperone HslO [Defluviitaleaceae bacterium]|nr:Hsp33 family molecular chaperone HslO [Defluviitaleaceae bacterium]
MDYSLSITAANSQIRGFFANTRETAETARKNYNTTPVVSAAVGRLLTGTAIMGLMLKNNKDILTVSLKGDGPMQGIIATADSMGNVVGYAYEPHVVLPLKSNGKLDVGGAIGAGHIHVIKDMGLKEPFSSTLPLISGEVAEDLTRYFGVSEQTPSVVALGVLVDRDLSVKHAGGFVVQLMPEASDDVITKLETNLKTLDTVTNMMDKGLDPKGIMNTVLKDLNPVINETREIRFLCKCSKERARNALVLIGKDEILDILDKDGKANIHCHFCNSDYKFSKNELLELVKEVD